MDLQAVSTMCSTLLELERVAKAQEEALTELNARIRIIKEESIPMMMQELGLESISLTSGEKVTIFQEVYASIPASERERAYTWLVENNFGSIIKTSVEATFGKGEIENATAMIEQLQQLGFDAKLSRSVHASTLKAFLREQLANGTNIDLDMFGARPTWSTKIK